MARRSADPPEFWHNDRHKISGSVGSENPAHTEVQAGQGNERVGPARLERATSCSGGKRSIQLSYGRVLT